MVLVVGLGLEQVFDALPRLHALLRWIGAAYLLWLAWKIARAGPMSDGRPGGSPMTALQAAAFQWNPKAWVIVFGAVSIYAPRGGFGPNVIILAAGSG